MDAKAALAKLEALGKESIRRTYARHGIRGPLFGVSYADLGKLRKAIGRDHALALALWDSKNHDARVLATMVADPGRIERKTIAAWGRALGDHVLADALAGLAAETPHAAGLARDWIASDGDWESAAGWSVVARLAAEPEPFAADELARWIGEIECGIHASQNRTRHAMNMALIAIALRSPALQAQALEAARRIGKVEVDHLDTSCRTPDAANYIEKTVARRSARARPAPVKRGGAAGKAVAERKASKRATRR
jgi:3-methyladenine DNA glycosylase AlkD